MRYCKPLQYWRQFCGNKNDDCFCAEHPHYKYVENKPAKPKAVIGTGGFKLRRKKK